MGIWQDAQKIADRGERIEYLLNNIEKNPVSKLKIGPVTVQILRMRVIKRSVHMWVRAWYNDVLIGWGPDRDCEIEQITIVEPGLLMADDAGDIYIDYHVVDLVTGELTGEIVTNRLAFNPRKALLRHIVTGLLAKTERQIGAQVKAGKVGRSTLTVYTAPDTGISNADWRQRFNNGGTPGFAWSTLTGASTGNANQGTQELAVMALKSNATSGWDECWEQAVAFDTSGLGSGATINSANLSLYCSFKVEDFDDSLAIVSTDWEGDMGTDDWNGYGSTFFSEVNLTSITTSARNTFTLDSNGQGFIDKTGYTNFGIRFGSHAGNGEPAAGTGETAQANIAHADYEPEGNATDQTNYHPRLTVEYTGTATFQPKALVY